MKLKTLVAILGMSVAALFVMPGMAFGWSGANIVTISCPELHLYLPKENGKWRVIAKDELGRVLKDIQVSGGGTALPDGSNVVIGNTYEVDNGEHIVTVAVGSAANMRDGYKQNYIRWIDCAPPVGVQGPPGPSGPSGPAGPPGTSGTDGTDGSTTSRISTATNTIIREDDCTSKYEPQFIVRRKYRGQVITKVRATMSKGFKVTTKTITKDGHRRFQVHVKPVSNNAKHPKARGRLRTVTVYATLANGRHARLVWFFRQCADGDEGNPNDPSAAGNHGPGA